MSIIIKFLLLVQRYFIYIYYFLRDKKIAQMIDFRVFFEVHLIYAVYDSFKIQNSLY